MWVVGTAGHVDHGKSTLVEALTGIHPDRLKEEKQREMTIELGFAWFKLPTGEPVGIVDVPGHRDFIENMLAGVGGIDAVLFIVAADEGVMPQTREHLAILDLLQIKTGIIVLTKVDLVPDPDWLDLVEQEVREFCKGTILQDAPLVRVSAVNGEGISQLKQVLADRLAATPEKVDLGKPRLAVDRVFTLSGYGTVVTGTLVDGSFTLGDEVQVQPGELTGRIRGIQTYNQKVNTAPPGSRTALNIAGIDREWIVRGNVITLPGGYQPTQRLDARVRMVKDASAVLMHDDKVKFFIGATEVEGRVRVLGREKIAPGEEGFVQIELNHPVVAVAGDRYVLRIPSPPQTIAGGVVLDPQPSGRYRLKDEQVLSRLERLAEANPGEELLHNLDRRGMVSLSEIKAAARMEDQQARQLIEDLITKGDLIAFSNEPLAAESRLMTATGFQHLTNKAKTILIEFHQENPTRLGMGREVLKTKLGLNTADFSLILKRWLDLGRIVQEGALLRLPEHQVKFTPAQQKKKEELLGKFEQSPFAPPAYAECVQIAGEALVNSLIESGVLYRVNGDVVFTLQAVGEMSNFILERSHNPLPFTVAEFRDRFNTSRKYSLAFLEHLDDLKATRRDGEGRLLINPANLP